MLTRVTVAGIGPLMLAKSIQDAGLSGTVFPSIGAGDWGVELGSTAEFAHPDDILKIIRWWAVGVMAEKKQESVYVTVDGRPRLWTARGDVEAIPGVPVPMFGRTVLPELIP